MRMRTLRPLALIGAAVALSLALGCQQKQQTTEVLEQPIEPPAQQQQKQQDGPLEALAFWNWGQSDEPDYAQKDEGGGWFGLGGDDELTEDDILSDMSPELDQLAETPGEVRIRHARTLDTSGRQAWDDLDRILMLDRPRRLSMMPVP